MDSKTIFARTSKGEDEVRSKTSHLSGDIKRSLLMVDGVATFDEISKRAAPSLRSGIEQMFNELVQGGFIQEIPKAGNMPRMVVPPKMVTPVSKPVVDEGDNELDFSSELRIHAADKQAAEADDTQAQTAAAAKAEQEAEAKARQQREAAKLKALQAAQARGEAQRQPIAEVAAETPMAQQQAGAMPLQPVMEPTQDKVLAEMAKSKSGSYHPLRTTSATVLFFDVVGYTMQPVNKQIKIKKQFNQVVSDCLRDLEEGELIILDTGDGAAIGFLQHPEDALKVAMQFHKTVTANQHKDYPELTVRIGIHLGPINVVKDMNGLSNMVGDGINDAQRVMSFAGPDQIFISRPYHDFISRLSSEYQSLFNYQGTLLDKHGREHRVYKLADVVAPVVETGFSQASSSVAEVKLEPFNFTVPSAAAPSTPTVSHAQPALQQNDAVLMQDILKFIQPEEVKKSPATTTAGQSQTQTVAPASGHAPETTRSGEAVKSDAEERKPSGEPPSHSTRLTKNDNQVAGYAGEVEKIEDAQAKAWAEAERRAKQAAKAKAMWDVQTSPHPQPAAKMSAPVAQVKRKPLPWFKLGAGLVVVLLIVLFVAPFVIPTREYVPRIEQLLSGKLHQPVYIGRLEGRLLPMPRLDLIDMSIGDTKQIKARQARVNFAILTLFTETKSIDSVELEGVQVNGAALQQVSAWLQQAAADPDYPITSIVLSDGKLETEGMALSGVGGVLNFDRDGKFSLAKMQAEGNKYVLGLEAAPEYKTRFSLAVRGSALPLLPNWVFEDLTAKGELTGNELVITDIGSHIMGGILLGNARINWHSGWRAQGSLVAKTMTMQNIFKSLSGDMDGTARFQMQSASLAKLTDAATLDGSFVIKNGVINGIDIVETARLHRTENMPGGRTHFDELSGELSYTKDAFAFRQMKMSAGVLAAKGMVDYSGQQLAGSITADLALGAGMRPVSLQLGGTRDNPTLVAR